MKDYRQIIENAKPGQIIPVVKQIEIDDPMEFFAKISDYGRAENCCLFESKEHLAEAGTGQLSFGTSKPALYLCGKGNEFQIKALSSTGKRMLSYLNSRKNEIFGFCESYIFGNNSIKGTIAADNGGVTDEQSRLKSTNQMDVLRAVAFSFTLASKPFRVNCGLFGALSYDFIDQFEKLPPSSVDILDNPDYELYFADNIFLVDHSEHKGYIIVNVVVTDDDTETAMSQAQQVSDYYFNMARFDTPQTNEYETSDGGTETDTNQVEYEAMVKTAKDHIVEGDIFQVVLSRTIIEPCRDEPLNIYRRLRKLNPSPYMFYLNTPNTILMGSSPELNLRVSVREGKRVVEIRPIAGTKPRGRVNGVIDQDIDFRYETELKLDQKELAEHMMLVDLARNDIARVAQPGTRIVDELLVTERYESVMHLVSNVKGQLNNDLDALSAYLATMNMGTLSGAPKIEAMKIIRELEKTKRGYYGGAVMYLTVDGQFDSCITIRSLQVKDNKAYVRAGAGIVFDSVPATEFAETEHKAGSCLKAIRGSGTGD